MNYCQLFTDHHIATLHDWLAEMKELFVYLEFPHSGGSGFSYSVFSLEELKALISKQTHDEIEIFIFKNKPLDEAELDKKLETLWVYQNSTEALYLAVLKNCNYNAEYKSDPHKYQKAIAIWFD